MCNFELTFFLQILFQYIKVFFCNLIIDKIKTKKCVRKNFYKGVKKMNMYFVSEKNRYISE